MEYNIDTLLNTFDAPVIQIHGVKYQTKQLSFKDYLVNQSKLGKITEMPPEEVVDLIKHLCHLTDLPADIVMALPMQAAIQVIVSLFTDTNNTPIKQ